MEELLSVPIRRKPILSRNQYSGNRVPARGVQRAAPTIKDIKSVIKHLKNGKAADKNDIKNELIKYEGTKLITKIHNILRTIWKEQEMPRGWTEVIIFPVHKKGEKPIYNNYKGIALLDVKYCLQY